MFENIDFYYFSPTGGTKKSGLIFANTIAENVNMIDLGKADDFQEGESNLAVFAAPVFAGRIPAIAADKIQILHGNGKKMITMAVYGVRAYDDALLEMNDIVLGAGFELVASAAVVAQHSVVPVVGAGRPDEKDADEIKTFAVKVMEKIESNITSEIHVPGNRPYVERKGMPFAPICTSACTSCGSCVEACPLGAMKLEEDKVVTDVETCILCMACTAACPVAARILPPPVQESMNEKLGALKDVRRENEFYLE